MYTSFPLLALPVVVYNVIAWGGSLFSADGAQGVLDRMDVNILSIPMVSGVRWEITPGDMLITLSLILLFLELLKSTNSGRAAIVNHSFSMVLFIFCLIEFLLFKQFATSVFFFIMLMTLLDVMAGFIVTIVTARRDIAVGDGPGD